MLFKLPRLTLFTFLTPHLICCSSLATSFFTSFTSGLYLVLAANILTSRTEEVARPLQGVEEEVFLATAPPMLANRRNIATLK